MLHKQDTFWCEYYSSHIFFTISFVYFITSVPVTDLEPVTFRTETPATTLGNNPAITWLFAKCFCCLLHSPFSLHPYNTMSSLMKQQTSLPVTIQLFLSSEEYWSLLKTSFMLFLWEPGMSLTQNIYLPCGTFEIIISSHASFNRVLY